MRTVKRAGEYELEIKKSRFLCAVARITDESEAREFVQRRRKLHHDARHHCSAYVLGEQGQTQKSNDDGEPAGTAGMPMLEVLRHREITNTIAVVSRYFGGVLLGAGGLVRAYGSAVSAALDHVGLVQRMPMRVVSTTVDYGLAGRLENSLRSAGYHVAEVHYADNVQFVLHVDDSGVADFQRWVAEVSAGGATVVVGETTFAEVEL